ncbi:MAG: phospholipid carrier-dependent glycosyltransferase [Caldilineaceae bacterium SB0664_bin_27]|uniref:Phospholipid carrier-dependent glycosyltransferase n=1 Tax=Caldilineaceae bacterium SB0664_bin_27 TaxID=2605260 RepID=A0A6B0Z230_9CHLR|nr:phospholipid carrier-dependent glycosyltransferase [Caldilineaceae bacterium SB0664_bin_27]
MNRPPRHSKIPIAWAYCALAAFFFTPFLLRLSAFAAGDFTRHYLPYSFFQQKSLLAGRLPVWNPHVNSGHPFLADTESAVFYPVSNILLLVTSFSSTVVGRLYWLQMEAFVHILLACIFTALLVQRLTGRRVAGFAAGLVFGFSGYLTGYPLVQLGILRVVVWLPLILWLLLPGEPGKPVWRRWLLACAVHAVAFFANHPQTFLFLTYMVAGWMFMLAVSQSHPSHQSKDGSWAGQAVRELDYKRMLQYLGHMIAYAAILIALTVAQLWPALEFTSLSVRSARPFHELSSGFPPEDFWQFVVPGVLSHYSPLYVGIAGLGLALIAMAALLSNRFRLVEGSHFARPAAIFFVAAGFFACLISLGDLLPVYPLLYRFAPGWSLFRGQERIAYLIAFSASTMSGFGLALLHTLSVRWRQRFGWCFLVIVAGGVALVFTLWHSPGQLEFSNVGFLFQAGKSILLAAVFGVLCSGVRLSRSRFAILLLVIVADLFATNFTTNLANGQEIRSALSQPELVATQRAAKTLAEGTTSLPPRVYNERRLPEDSGMVAGWEDVWAASVLRLSTYNPFFVDFPPDRMWRITGVGTVLTWREELPVDSRLVEEFPRENESSRLHTLSTVYPRLWWAQRARSTDDISALALLADPEFDPQREILIAKADAKFLGEAWEDGRMSFGEGDEASLVVDRIASNHLEIQISSAQPGLLFISENFMPGWRAEWTEADRSSPPATLPVARAHQAFLAVPIPSGKGTLDLAYRPASVRWGIAISAVSWMALLFALRRQLVAVIGSVWKRSRRLPGEIWYKASTFLTVHESLEAGEGEDRESCLSSQGMLADIRFLRLAVTLATLAGFALRFYRLEEQELISREAFSYWFSQLHFSELVDMFGAFGETLFLGSLSLQHFWLPFVGTTEFALRSMSALLGTLAIPLVYVLAKEMRWPHLPCLTAAFLMAVSTYAIGGSQDVPLYSLSLTLTLAGATLALRFVNRGWTKVSFLAYVLCGAATVYTHAFAVLAFLAQNLYVLIVIAHDRRRNRNTPSPALDWSVPKGWALAQLTTVALCIPWLASAWPEMFDVTGGNSGSSLVSVLWWRYSSFPMGSLFPDRIWLLNAGFLGAGLVAAAVFGDFLVAKQKPVKKERNSESKHDAELFRDSEPQNSRRMVHHPIILLLLLLLVSPIAFWTPFYRKWFMFGSFYSVALPPFFLLMASGLAHYGDLIESWLGWRWKAWTAEAEGESPTFLKRVRVGNMAAISLLLVLVGGNLFTLQNYHFEPAFSRSRGLRDLSAAVDSWSAGLNPEQVRILQSFSDPTFFLYYYKGDVEDSVLPLHDQDLEEAEEAVRLMRQSNIQRIILPVSLNDDQEAPNLARRALSSSYQLAGQEAVGPWLVELYSRPRQEDWRLFDLEFANGLVLERAQVNPAFPPAAGRLVVHLEWRGDLANLTGGEKIFLHLLDETGRLVAQWDPELRMDSASHSTAVAMPIPSALPAGSLRLVAGLYDVTVEGAPRILTGSGEDSVQLAYFHVSDCDVCGR